MVNIHLEHEFNWITVSCGNRAIKICYDNQKSNFRIEDAYGCFDLERPSMALFEVINEVDKIDYFPHGELNWKVVRDKILKDVVSKLRARDSTPSSLDPKTNSG